MTEAIRGEDYPVLAKIWENDKDDKAFSEETMKDTVKLIIERVAMDADPQNFSPKSSIQNYSMTIPRTWKVIYGPPIDGENNSEGPFCLRVFEDDDRMRAVIFNVVGFRAEELDWTAIDGMAPQQEGQIAIPATTEDDR